MEIKTSTHLSKANTKNGGNHHHTTSSTHHTWSESQRDEHQTNQTTNQQNINSIQTNVYSRVGEDTSLRYFNVAQRIGQLLQQSNASIQSIILDGEMVAVDRTTSTLLPFQELTKRSRDSTTVSEHSEHNTKESERPADVCYYIFDILELNGKSLLNQTIPKKEIS